MKYRNWGIEKKILYLKQKLKIRLCFKSITKETERSIGYKNCSNIQQTKKAKLIFLSISSSERKDGTNILIAFYKTAW
jgi:hypothetical protein